MRDIIIKIAALFLLLGTINLQAQEINNVRQPGYWTLGINGGWAYQQSDVRSQFNGYGVGLTLAKNMAYRPGGHLSLDLRGRFLYANMYGLDGTRFEGIENNEALNGTRTLDYTEGSGPGFVYSNYNTRLGELSAEAVIHLNRLRENTNWDVSVYGGIGLDIYNTQINQLNGSDTYTDLYIDAPLTNARSELRNFLDDTYETRADGFNGALKAGIMPSLGVEAYYWLTPRFAAGFGHRATWSQTDILDGQRWTTANEATGDNDIYHYTSVGLKWIINGRSRLGPPIIDVTEPITSPYNSPIPDGFLRANIKNVNSADQITLRVNGRSTQFNYYNGKLSASFPLRKGRNEAVIHAKNNAGSDRASVIYIYQEDTYETPPPPSNVSRPSVRFTNPSQNSTNTSRPQYTVEASISGVRDKRDINFMVNGRTTNFEYNGRRGLITSTINLNQGRNDIRISATNSGGSDNDEATIYYDRTVPQPTVLKPTVRITNPTRDPYKTPDSVVDIEADIENVDRKEDIDFLVNGRRSSSFTFNERTGILRAEVRLNNGENTVEVVGHNQDGKASDRARIISEQNTTPPPPAGDRPEVNITSVSTPMAPNCETTIRATILNVDSQRDINFKINGHRVSDFTFSGNTFRSTVVLYEERNTIFIEARNDIGTDSDSEVAICAPEEENNNVSVEITTPSKQSTTTNQSKATIKAKFENVNSKNEITMLVNGDIFTNFTFSKSSQLLNATITLRTGNNDVRIRAKNANGEDDDTAAIRYIKEIGNPAVEKPPVVKITSPENHSETTKSTTVVKASITNVIKKSDITVLVNNKSITNFSYSNKIVSATATLTEGANKIEVRAKNTDGADEDKITVYYEPPAAQVSVDITSPSNGATLSVAKATFKASTKNINSKNEITMLVNGQLFSNFTFSKSTQKVTASIDLQTGSNDIGIRVKNAGGVDEDEVRVTYERPVPKVSVDITSPTNGSTVSVAKATFKANTKNVSSKNEVTMLVNGELFSNFTFSKSTQKVTASVTLQTGNNDIAIRVKNAGGSDDDQVRVKYTRQVTNLVSKPTVNITKPTAGSTTKTSSATVEATVKNVKSKDDITFKLNGKLTDNFTLLRGRITAKVNLIVGKNTINITVKNSSGTDSDATNITYQKDRPVLISGPKVEITSASEPTVSPFNPSVGKSTILATVKNISRKDQITFTVNGQKVTDFTWSGRSGAFKAIINLKEGDNKVVIKATANGQTAKDEVIVKF